jgi:hypothetical protein
MEAIHAAADYSGAINGRRILDLVFGKLENAQKT